MTCLCTVDTECTVQCICMYVCMCICILQLFTLGSIGNTYGDDWLEMGREEGGGGGGGGEVWGIGGVVGEE